jgi:hypothetical protein
MSRRSFRGSGGFFIGRSRSRDLDWLPMMEVPMKKYESRIERVKGISLALLLAVTSIGQAGIVTFDDLELAPQSYWDGSDGSGGFTSGGAFFVNNYDIEWQFWDGFAYSNGTDVTATALQGQYNAIAGSGQGGSANYGVAYVGWAAPPTIMFDTPQKPAGVYVTNNVYAYYDMHNGSAFSKKFGGASGNDEDWLKLTITGRDADGTVTDAVDFYLADLRFADNSQDYILDSWAFVDLRSLGEVKTLEFSLASSDSGASGMNTPAYFCLDSLITDPPLAEPAGPGKPYSSDPAVNGYIDPATGNRAAPKDPNAVLNPLFRAWADGVPQYSPADDTWSGDWNDPTKALGPVAGDNLDLVSLGELTQAEIDQGAAPGQITLVFGDPNDPQSPSIRNGKGFDFVVFENSFASEVTTPNGSLQGQLLAELAYVEVSSNGHDFVRFASVSLTPQRVGLYGTIEMGDVHNLAGKHPNSGGVCTGTAFDLEDLAGYADVVSGKVDLQAIRYVRLVDIPGSGDFLDEATSWIDPNTWPQWSNYTDKHPIYDFWPTWGSGGFDLDAVGVLNEQRYEADVNLDGVVDARDLDLMNAAWGSHFGEANWNSRCDLASPRDLVIDSRDMDVLASQWGCVESWRQSSPAGDNAQ